MKRSRRSGLLGLAMVLWTTGVLCSGRAVAAEAPEPPPETPQEEAVPAPEAPPVPRLEAIWEERRKALQAGDTAAADALLPQLLEARLDSGMRSAETLSAVLIQEGLAAMERHEYEMAFHRLRMAKELSPDYPPAYYAMGKAYWKQHWWHALKALDEYLTGLRMSFGNFWWLFYGTGNLLLWLGVGLLVGYLVFAVVLLFRYFPLLMHTVSERVPIPEGLVGAGFLVVWALPVALNLGVFWSLVLIFGSLWVFTTFRERVIIAGFLVVMALVPLWLRTTTVFLVAPEIPYVRALVHVQRGWVDEEDLEALEARAEAGRADPLALFALGLQAKRTGDFQKAETLYQRYLKREPGSARGHVNLGNVYLAQGEPRRAMTAYLRALELDPNRVEAQYNLSQVYREEFLFEEGERAYRAAKALDPDAVNRFRRWSGPHYNRRVVDVNLSVGDLWQAAFREVRFPRTPAWVTPMAGIPNGWLPAMGVLLALALGGGWWMLQRRPLALAYACRKCGQVVCPRCQPHARNRLCTQCLHALVVMEGVGPTERVRKLLEIERHQGRRRLFVQILSLLYPGSGHVFGGATVLGGVALLATSLWVVAWATGWGPLVPPTRLVQSSGTGLFLVGLLVIYGLVLRDTVKRFR